MAVIETNNTYLQHLLAPNLLNKTITLHSLNNKKLNNWSSTEHSDEECQKLLNLG